MRRMGRKLALWYAHMSLRLRMVLVAGSAVVVVFALGSVLIVLAVRDELVDAVDDLAELRAQQVAALAERGELPATLSLVDDVEAAVQVVRDGAVISATPNAPGGDFFAVPEQSPGSEESFDLEELLIDEDGPFRVTALGTRTPQGNATVIVAVDAEDVDEVTEALIRGGAIGLAILLLGVGSVLWAVTGRMLASVDAIRQRAELITGQRLQERVPESSAKDEIYHLARTINEMLERLESSAKRQERFVADAAHEFRTPLATLRALLESALARGGEVDQHRLAELLDEAVRLSSLVEHLLLLARGDAGMLRADVQPVDLDDVVRNVASSTRAGELQLKMRSIQPVQVWGDPTLLDLVVRNLVDNAMRHAKAVVDVWLTSDSDTAELMVDDDGPGIAPEDRSEVFQRFTRLDHSRDRPRGGAGLGLAIVAEVVRVHFGSVEVTDSPAHGARLRVRLPLAQPAPETALSGDPVKGSGLRLGTP